jgi:uncharacterized protein (DUF2235 family)
MRVAAKELREQEKTIQHERRAVSRQKEKAKVSEADDDSHAGSQQEMISSSKSIVFCFHGTKEYR